MAITDLTSSIKAALKKATGSESFAQGLLRDCLRWPIDCNTAGPEEVSYHCSADELSAPELERKLTAHEIPLGSKQPYGIFLLEFMSPYRVP